MTQPSDAEPSTSYEPPTSPPRSEGPPAAYGTPPAYQPPQYAPQPAQQWANPPSTQLRPSEEVNWSVAAHLSGFLGALFGLTFVGPLVVLLVAGQRSPVVRQNAVEALNFNLSLLIYGVVGLLLTIVLIGFVLLLAIGLLFVICSVLGALAASRGAQFRYPLTLRLVK